MSELQAKLRQQLRIPRNPGDAIFRVWTLAMATAVVVLIGMLLVELVSGSWQGLVQYGHSFFVTSRWDPVHEVYGALPAIYGTVVSSLVALLIAGPLGLLIAIFLAELAPRWLDAPLSFLIELLASIPSVVFGLWGLFVLAPILRDPVGTTLHNVLGFLPLFDCTPLGLGLFSAIVILAIMILPYATSVARDSLRAVPRDQREAALALGATPWETIWQVVVPYARSGIFGGLMLALGRAIGETMAVTMMIGNRPEVSACLLNPAYTLASQIANEFSEATTPMYVSVLILLGLTLFVITLILNGIARLLINRIKRQGAGAAS